MLTRLLIQKAEKYAKTFVIFIKKHGVYFFDDISILTAAQSYAKNNNTKKLTTCSHISYNSF